MENPEEQTIDKKLAVWLIYRPLFLRKIYKYIIHRARILAVKNMVPWFRTMGNISVTIEPIEAQKNV